MDRILRSTDHRPFPLPRRPAVGVMVWHDLLFAHWPLPPEDLRPLVPPELALDTFKGQAWVAVAPFHMSNVRPRLAPPVPGLSRFAEINVRTYVTMDGKPGVYFFSLDAASRVAVAAARFFYRLPYFYAHMEVRVEGDEVRYRTRRAHGRAAEFVARYRPTSEQRRYHLGTLEHWLTERYILYTVDRGRVYGAEIHHLPWPLQTAEAEVETNTMAWAAGIILPMAAPLLHFAKKLKVYVWLLERIR